MAEAESKIKPSYQHWKGINQRISSTNCPEGVFTNSIGVFNVQGRASRINGKVLQSLQNSRVLAIFHLSKIVLIQTKNQVISMSLDELLSR